MAFIPSIRRNLIYVPILYRLGYSFLLGLEKLIYIKTLYWMEMEHFVGIFTN